MKAGELDIERIAKDYIGVTVDPKKSPGISLKKHPLLPSRDTGAGSIARQYHRPRRDSQLRQYFMIRPAVGAEKAEAEFVASEVTDRRQ